MKTTDSQLKRAVEIVCQEGVCESREHKSQTREHPRRDPVPPTICGMCGRVHLSYSGDPRPSSASLSPVAPRRPLVGRSRSPHTPRNDPPRSPLWRGHDRCDRLRPHGHPTPPAGSKRSPSFLCFLGERTSHDSGVSRPGGSLTPPANRRQIEVTPVPLWVGPPRPGEGLRGTGSVRRTSPDTHDKMPSPGFCRGRKSSLRYAEGHKVCNH